MIYSDMDGILTDFTTAYLKLVNSELIHDDIKNWDIYLHTSQTEKEFWNTLELAGEDFWEHISPYIGCFDMIKKLQSIDKITILTSVFSPSAAIGKIKWLNKWLPQSPIMPVCFDTEKWKYANSDSILIDDKPENIIEFIEHGGRGLLYPQPWNENFRDLPLFNLSDFK